MKHFWKNIISWLIEDYCHARVKMVIFFKGRLQRNAKYGKEYETKVQDVEGNLSGQTIIGKMRYEFELL